MSSSGWRSHESHQSTPLVPPVSLIFQFCINQLEEGRYRLFIQHEVVGDLLPQPNSFLRDVLLEDSQGTDGVGADPRALFSDSRTPYTLQCRRSRSRGGAGGLGWVAALPVPVVPRPWPPQSWPLLRVGVRKHACASFSISANSASSSLGYRSESFSISSLDSVLGTCLRRSFDERGCVEGGSRRGTTAACSEFGAGTPRHRQAAKFDSHT